MLERLDKLEEMERRFLELDRLMADPQVATNHQEIQRLAKERASMENLVSRYRDYKSVSKELEDSRRLLEDGLDDEMKAFVQEETTSLERHHASLEAAIEEALTTRDPRDEKSVIIEVRAGAGGDEAALFAADLFRMYSRYAQTLGFDVDVLNTNATGIGGFKEIIFQVKGQGAFGKFKYESGVHRVQRVPTTESSGRIHTSTITVAVISEVEEVEVSIDPGDLKVDIFHAGGAGGQNVNKVATAVRITYLPTGMVVVCQDERSQLKNKTKAMSVLRARLYDIEIRKQQQEMAEDRRSQVGTGDRAEKVRTYNFPQDRVTDHRIGMTLHNLSGILEGDMGGLVQALAAREREEMLVKAGEG
ncbi:MAG: peptide chain release factor 1 [Dehalococcoidia bacterium]